MTIIFRTLLTVRLLGVWGLLFFFRLGGATGTGTDDSTLPSKLNPLMLFELFAFFVLAITSGSCKGTETSEDWDSSLFLTKCKTFEVSSLPLFENFWAGAIAESGDKLRELCDVEDEVSGNESSSFPPDVEGNTAGGNVRLSRPVPLTENK